MKHLFKIRIKGLRKSGTETWNVESILCDEFQVQHGPKDGFRRIKRGPLVDLAGEFVYDPVGGRGSSIREIDISSGGEIGVMDIVPDIRAMIYRAAERYIETEIEAYPVEGGTVYRGSELEFARMKKDGLLDADLGDMEGFEDGDL